MPLSGGWKNPKHKGGERFALLVLSMYQGAPCRIADLMEETGMSKRQIVRIVDDLKASGAVVTEGGKGRSPLIIKLASYNDDIMSSQEPANDAITSYDKVASQADPPSRSDAKMSSLYDAAPLCHQDEPRSDDKMSGTKVAPLEAETITQSTVDANASTAPPGAVSLKSYIGRLIQFREGELGTKLPAQKQEAVAAKWLFEAGYRFDEVVACYRFLIPRCKGWKTKGVTLNDVVSAIGDWKKGNLGEAPESAPRPARAGPKSNVERSMEAVSSFIAKEQAKNVRRVGNT